MPPSKLPVPFFQVLEEEDLALHEPDSRIVVSWEKTLSAKDAWLFIETHLGDSLRQLKSPYREIEFREFGNKLRSLLSEERGQENEVVTEEMLVTLLNRLVANSKCLYKCRRFPKENLKGDTAKIAKLKVNDDERALVNRLLLENLFPNELRRIYDIRLTEVYARIHARAQKTDPSQRKLQTALCFSGGGIRSATFALGILQGLARRDLLPEFDYLSTVSGGGYIGSWLSSWIHHAQDSLKVFTELKQEQAPSPTEPEPGPVTHLRRFSNYLTPTLGAFSTDTWTLIGTYLRNLFVNWLVFIPILLALFAVPRIYRPLLGILPPQWVFDGFFLLGGLCLICAVAYTALSRPSVAANLPKGSFWSKRQGQGSFLRWCLIPLCGSAFFLSTCWSWLHAYNHILSLPHLGGFTFGYPPHLAFFVVFGAVLHLVGWLIAEGWLRRFRTEEFLAGAIALVTGALGGALLWCVASFDTKNTTGSLHRLDLVACFAVPMFLFLFLVTASIFIGLLSRKTSDEDREWWARMGAWVLIVIVAWVIFNAFVIFGKQVFIDWAWNWVRAGVVAAGGVFGAVTLLLGRGSETPSKSQDQKGSGWRQILLFLSAPLLLVYVVVGLVMLTQWILQTATPLLGLAFEVSSIEEVFDAMNKSQLILALAFFVAAASFGTLLSFAINVNKFSIHAIYRDRLVRAYLGASNPKRNPHPFTGFDPRDNLGLQHLRNPLAPRLPQRPMHIINMALNLVAGENLAWQQRKAETFTASTLYCGNHRLGFRPTEDYAQNEKGEGLSLGSAIAISGAAASPNEGYHSSPLVAMLMTLFNVRLGWWLGNPGLAGHATFRLPAPKSPVLHMVKEGLGMTDSTTPYIYLSDGGHFENLGLYEMILRRCHLIVVSDAGCDPKCSLEDLGGAIRKIRIDLGVKIEIKEFCIYSRNNQKAESIGKYCAIGDIDYSAVDGKDAPKGTLLYFKPTICGEEPRDVFSYKEEHQEFPHESTGDQWFTESQFESYRKLGLNMIDQLSLQPTSPVGDPLLDFVACAREYIHRKAAAPDGCSPSGAQPEN